MQYSHGYQSSYARKILELVLLYYNIFKTGKKKPPSITWGALSFSLNIVKLFS